MTKDKIIHVSREVWDKMRNGTKRIIYDKVKVIDSPEVREDGDQRTSKKSD